MNIEFAAHRGVKRRVRNSSVQCERATRLDKYYTTPAAARQCLDMLEPFLDADTLLIEPSAGAGAFVNETDRDIIGLDIDPDASDIIARDFLTLPVRRQPNVVFVGNPPFGKKGNLAAEFINRCLKIGGTVGFILPASFRRWSSQRMVNPAARLVLDYPVPSDFDFCGKLTTIKATFQVWTTRTNRPDLRLKVKPASRHPDFDMWVYNATGPALRFLDEPWDFAVPRWGCYDYSKKFWDRADLTIPKRHYVLFKASSATAMRRLLKIDYAKIAQTDTMIPHVGRPEVVAAYEAIVAGEAA